MPYYCTVPQCTSLAGKAKDVSFHQFPRDDALGMQWNRILKRNKPYTKYSKVCSRHFTSDDYTMTHMGKNKGQWKTLNKDAVPSQNLPKINADGSVMVIRKGRSPKYKNEDSDPNHSGLEDHSSLATLAKGYLASNSGEGSMKNESPSPWYSQDEQEEELEDEEDVKDVKVKEEYPPKRKVQTQDATIQTDLCQEGIGFRKSLLDPCPGYANYFPQPMSDTTGMTNYFQTSTTEHLSLPKDPLSMGQGQCVFGKPPFYAEPHYNSMLGQHAVKTNRNH